MKQPVTFKHEFVQFIPEELQEGTVYVSIPAEANRLETHF